MPVILPRSNCSSSHFSLRRLHPHTSSILESSHGHRTIIYCILPASSNCVIPLFSIGIAADSGNRPALFSRANQRAMASPPRFNNSTGNPAPASEKINHPSASPHDMSSPVAGNAFSPKNRPSTNTTPKIDRDLSTIIAKVTPEQCEFENSANLPNNQAIIHADQAFAEIKSCNAIGEYFCKQIGECTPHLKHLKESANHPLDQR